MDKMPGTGGGLFYLVVLTVFAVIVIGGLSAGNPNVERLNSQEWQQAVENGALVTDIPEGEEGRLTVYDENQTVRGLLDRGEGEPQEFEYAYAEDANVVSDLEEAGIPFHTDPQNTGFWLTLLGTLAPILLIVFVFLFLMRQIGAGNQADQMRGFGKSRARRMTKDQPKVTFSDVAGADEAVQELTEIKEFL
ncbi:MAG: cell division protein FtsH, partial [Actinomycetota bacterium]|nr:cell division protein FtsH [Actinomycetota bacterium]